MMGWGTCGKNPVTGDMMGYCYEGVCAADDCDGKIDHGLSYVCGGMHEGDGIGCGRYFCGGHLICVVRDGRVDLEHSMACDELVQVCGAGGRLRDGSCGVNRVGAAHTDRAGPNHRYGR